MTNFLLIAAFLTLGCYMKLYIVSNNWQTMNTKLFFTAIAIVSTFSIVVTAITTNVSAQNMTEGNMTGGNATVGNASGSISGECSPYRAC